MNTVYQQKKHSKRGENLKKYWWPKGVSGNLRGRPTGKSLKTYTKDYFASLPDDEKLKFLKENIDPELAWRMGEGNPENKSDITSGGQPIPILGGLTEQNIEK